MSLGARALCPRTQCVRAPKPVEHFEERREEMFEREARGRDGIPQGRRRESAWTDHGRNFSARREKTEKHGTRTLFRTRASVVWLLFAPSPRDDMGVPAG